MKGPEEFTLTINEFAHGDEARPSVYTGKQVPPDNGRLLGDVLKESDELVNRWRQRVRNQQIIIDRLLLHRRLILEVAREAVLAIPGYPQEMVDRLDAACVAESSSETAQAEG